MKYCLVVMILSACSNQQVYDAIRANRLNDCERFVGEQRETCLKEVTEDYRTYEKNRQQQVHRAL